MRPNCDSSRGEFVKSRLTILLIAVAWLGCATAPAHAADAAPERRYLRIEGADGVPLNVLEIGDPAKPTVVLVHGIGQSHASFDAQFSDAVLTGALHVIAYDLRGHGQSGKPWTRDAYVTSEKWADDLARVIEHAHKEKVVVLGWSYGSLVVSDYLRKYGTRQLAAIALAGAYGGLTPPPPPPKEPPSPNFAADMKRMLEEQQSGDPAVRAAAIHRGVLRLTGKPMPGEWVAKSDVMGMLTATEARRYMFDRSLDNRDLVAKINVPLLVFIGGKDGSTPEAQGRELVAQVAGARASFYTDSGHSPFAEEPLRFNAELAQFVRSVTTPK
ncbi:MAG: hypothetical protein RL603_1611 [Pseudomonadota bacterium]